MKENDKLPHIIAGIALVLYLVFIFTISRPKDELQGLESGNIQRAIETNQYK